jgi:hypothetical protein
LHRRARNHLFRIADPTIQRRRVPLAPLPRKSAV